MSVMRMRKVMLVRNCYTLPAALQIMWHPRYSTTLRALPLKNLLTLTQFLQSVSSLLYENEYAYHGYLNRPHFLEFKTRCIRPTLIETELLQSLAISYHI